MKKTVVSIIMLFLLSFSLFTVSTTQAMDEPDEWFFSDDLVPGRELSWKLEKYEDSENGELGLTYDDQMQEGDIFKVKFLLDPDSLGLDNPLDLFTINETWGEFYINDNMITTNASEILLFQYSVMDYMSMMSRMSMMFIVLLMPVSVTYGNNTENFFELLADDEYLTDYSTSTNGMSSSYSSTLNKDLFAYKLESHIDYSEGDMTVKSDTTYEISYHIYLGILYKLQMDMSMVASGIPYSEDISEEMHIVFKSTETASGEGITIPFNWFYGVIGFLLIGLIASVIRRK